LPQINTRTHARAVIAVLGLAACGSANTTAPPTTTLRIDYGVSSDADVFTPEFAARSLRDSFKARGVTITPDQANCMARGFLNEFGMDELEQMLRDIAAGKPDDPDVVDRGVDAVIGCLPADVVAAIANRNA
jgi:hypothetical protein